MKSLGGHLLIASPYLSDRNFFRSVVLIVSHDKEHAFGLLLNRPSYESLGTMWEEMTGEPCEQVQPIRTGGPLEGPLMMIHRQAEYADTQVVPGVYLSTTSDTVGPLIASSRESLIAISGYSGWGAGQLEMELEMGGWMSLKATVEIVFADPIDQWQTASRHISDGILGGTNLRHAPADPSLN